MIFWLSMLIYFLGVATTVGILIEKQQSPDPGIWLAAFWPFTLFGYFGTKLARIFK